MLDNWFITLLDFLVRTQTDEIKHPIQQSHLPPEISKGAMFGRSGIDAFERKGEAAGGGDQITEP
jgi:hypothetical protein